MKRFPQIAWYGDATPSGEWAVLIPDVRIDTSRGSVSLPGENVLFLVCGLANGQLCLAGQGGGTGNCWVWNGAEWRAVGPTYGTSPCAFYDGWLYVSVSPAAVENVQVINPLTFGKTLPISQQIGARGIALVDHRGVHSVDGWYGLGGFAEALDLDGIVLGQRFDDGCGIVDRLLEPGNVQFIRAHREGDSIAVAMWKAKEGLCVCFWFTVAEIAGLPFPPQPPEPPDPEPPDPPDPPEPPDPDPPTPDPPMPPLKTTERYWLHPNIDSDVPGACHADLQTVDVFGLYVQWVLEDARWAKIDTLKDIRKQGVNLAIEHSCIMEGDPHGEHTRAAFPEIAQRVLSKGHRVSWLCMDEPITKAKKNFPSMGIDEIGFAIVKWIEEARQIFPSVKVKLIEAWPEIDLEQMRKCLMVIDSWGQHLDGWDFDIDRRRNPAYHAVLQKAKQYADDYKCPLGVKFAGYNFLTDAEYRADVQQFAEAVHTQEHWAVDHICVQSWARRCPTDQDFGPQDLPSNFGQDGLFVTFGYVQEQVFQ